LDERKEDYKKKGCWIVNKLREARIEADLSARNMAFALKEVDGRVDKFIISKIEHGVVYPTPDQYKRWCQECGVFPTEVFKWQDVDYGIKPTDHAGAPKRDTHKLHGRISCRLSDAELRQLHSLIQADGYDTVQAWLYKTVRGYIKRKERRNRYQQLQRP
jgi:transcriptional regulator with XRE-family HTH domain